MKRRIFPSRARKRSSPLKKRGIHRRFPWLVTGDSTESVIDVQFPGTPYIGATSKVAHLEFPIIPVAGNDMYLSRIVANMFAWPAPPPEETGSWGAIAGLDTAVRFGLVVKRQQTLDGPSGDIFASDRYPSFAKDITALDVSQYIWLHEQRWWVDEVWESQVATDIISVDFEGLGVGLNVGINNTGAGFQGTGPSPNVTVTTPPWQRVAADRRVGRTLKTGDQLVLSIDWWNPVFDMDPSELRLGGFGYVEAWQG